jgi:exopolyphosphatase/guanosine-5'-triphosphate,3'-diphosphate pyrophosphatase
VAALDLGSQTFRMVLAECVSSGPVIVESVLENCRLGEGVASDGCLDSAAVERCLGVLKGFALRLERFRPDRVIAVGTAALRNAVNSGFFLERAGEYGFDISILTGRQEAGLAARGAAAAVECGKEQTFLSLDVGGGSTEIALCRGSVVLAFRSLAFGAVSMTERFIHGGSRLESFASMERFVREGMAGDVDALKSAGACPARLVASGGTATTVAAMLLELEEYRPDLVRGLLASAESLEIIVKRLALMTPEQKRAVKGLEPARADVIEAGITIMLAVMRLFDFDKTEISDGGLLLGLLLTEFEKETDCHVEPSCARSLYF